MELSFESEGKSIKTNRAKFVCVGKNFIIILKQLARTKYYRGLKPFRNFNITFCQKKAQNLEDNGVIRVIIQRTLILLRATHEFLTVGGKSDGDPCRSQPLFVRSSCQREPEVGMIEKRYQEFRSRFKLRIYYLSLIHISEPTRQAS